MLKQMENATIFPVKISYLEAWLENLHVLAATLSFDVDVSHHPLPFVAPYFVT